MRLDLLSEWCVPCNGKEVSLFLYEGKLYANVEVDSRCPQEVFDRDVAGYINCDGYALALDKGEGAVAFVPSGMRQTIKAEIAQEVFREPQVVELTLYPGEARLRRV